MDNRTEVRDFLTSRPAKLSPEQAGVPSVGKRRVAGLRRGEVATVAGVSVEYYTRLARGNLAGVSTAVLDAVARALQLNETERAHLEDLARAANTSAAARGRRRPVQMTVRPSVQHLLAAMTKRAGVRQQQPWRHPGGEPAGPGAVLAAVRFVGRTGQHRPVPVPDPRAPGFFLDWERVARYTVGALRVEAGRNPYDRELSNLIGELSTRSDQFRLWWGANDVYVHRHVTKRFHHPEIGDLELTAEAMQLDGDTGQRLVAYIAAPGSPAEDGLRLLASWAATRPGATADAPTNRA